MSRKGGHGANSERWLLTYSDLITLLLAFFVLMYGISNSDLQKFRRLASSMRQAFTPGVSTTQPAQKLDGPPTDQTGGSISDDLAFFEAELSSFAAEQGLAGSVAVDLRPEGIAVVLANNTVFASGYAELGDS